MHMDIFQFRLESEIPAFDLTAHFFQRADDLFAFLLADQPCACQHARMGFATRGCRRLPVWHRH